MKEEGDSWGKKGGRGRRRGKEGEGKRETRRKKRSIAKANKNHNLEVINAPQSFFTKIT